VDDGIVSGAVDFAAETKDKAAEPQELPMISAALVLMLASSSDEAHVAWVACLQRKGMEFSRADAPVETVVEAAFGACADQEGAFYAARFKTPMGERLVAGPRKLNGAFVHRAKESQEKLRAEYKERLTGDILERRMASSSQARSQ
jgi:hypothetical protein